LSQTFPGSDHQDDRDNAPCDPKHSEEGPELVRPQSPNHVAKKIGQGHGTLTWTRAGKESNLPDAELDHRYEIRIRRAVCCTNAVAIKVPFAKDPENKRSQSGMVFSITNKGVPKRS